MMLSLVSRPDGTAWLEAGRLASSAEVLDLIGVAYGLDAVIVLPIERLDPGFFDLRTGLMGELAQKLVNYGLRAAVVGDTGGATSSRAFRDFVRETNRGRVLAILPDEAALSAWR